MEAPTPKAIYAQREVKPRLPRPLRRGPAPPPWPGPAPPRAWLSPLLQELEVGPPPAGVLRSAPAALFVLRCGRCCCLPPPSEPGAHGPERASLPLPPRRRAGNGARGLQCRLETGAVRARGSAPGAAASARGGWRVTRSHPPASRRLGPKPAGAGAPWAEVGRPEDGAGGSGASAAAGGTPWGPRWTRGEAAGTLGGAQDVVVEGKLRS